MYPEKIFLVGYRGTGKSRVGPEVASALGWPFVDADVELERQHDRTIRDIFAHEGETAFRDMETAILTDLANRSPIVLATGGGCVLRPENRDLLRSGFVVWLTAKPETITERIDADPSSVERRPNLTTGGIAEIRELLNVRETLYVEVANLILTTDEQSPSDLTTAILTAWTSFSTTCG